MNAGSSVRDHKQRVGEAAQLHVLEEGRHRLGVLLRARHQMQELLATLAREGPSRQYRLAFLPGLQPLGDAVDEQIGDLVFRQVTAGESLIVGPQPLAEFRDRRARQQQTTTLILEGVLDVAHRQPARQHLERQILQRLGMTLQVLANGRAERLLAAGHLRRGVLHEAFGRLQPPGPVAIAVALAGRGAVLVIVPPDRVPRFRFQCLLHDQPRRQLDQFLAASRRGQPSLDQCLKLFTSVHRSRYSLRHGVLLCSGRPPQPNPRLRFHRKGCTPTDFPASLGLHLPRRRQMALGRQGA